MITYARGKGLRFGYFADLTDGLDRSKEPPQWVALGRSIAEPQVQRVCRDYVAAAANDCAGDLTAFYSSPLLISVQVDVAWGQASNGEYQGVDIDFAGPGVPTTPHTR